MYNIIYMYTLLVPSITPSRPHTLTPSQVLLNLTHDPELGSHRVGEQGGLLGAILHSVFELPGSMAEEHHFDTLVLVRDGRSLWLTPWLGCC